eukprot:Rmarinus@m.7502
MIGDDCSRPMAMEICEGRGFCADARASTDASIPYHDAITTGNGTIAESDMPFVNRLVDMAHVFSVNADIITRIIDDPSRISSFEQFALLYCVQSSGAGKTTLGKQFPQQVFRNRDFQAFMQKWLKPIDCRFRDLSDLQPEWQYLQDRKEMRHVHLDVRTMKNVVFEAATLVADGVPVDRDLSPEDAAKFLVSYADRYGPTLFHFDLHFDEVDRTEQVRELKELQKVAVATWLQMWEIKEAKGADAMPRIYFLVTGKLAVPDLRHNIYLSDCGCRFLVLDMLTWRHVGEVRRHVMNLPHNPLKLDGLKDEDAGYLDRCLAAATGGSPRLLLYALRALHCLQPALDSRDNIHKAISDDVFDLLIGIKAVSAEFYPSRVDAPELACFRALLSFCLSGTRLQFHSRAWTGKEHMSIAHMLRFQPFSLSRCDMCSFTVHLPWFHLQAAANRFDSNPANVLLISMAGAAARMRNPRRIFDVLPAQFVVSQAALRMQSARSLVTWAEAFPTLLGDSRIAKEAAFHLGSKPYAIHPIAEPRLVQDQHEQGAQIGGSLYPAGMSESADLFHVQRQKDGDGFVSFEWQQKL